MPAARVLIVGGGIAGVATAWELSRRGVRDVVLLERDAGLGRRATGQSAAILRSVMAEPAVRRASLQGSRFLRNPPPDFGAARPVDPCGLLLVADAGSRGELRDWHAALAGELELVDLAAEQVRARAPHWRGPCDHGLYVPEEGRLDVPAILAAFERGARAGGVEFRLGARVAALARTDSAVSGVVLADGTRIAAERVVLAAGAWSSELARAAGSPIRLEAKRRHLALTLRSARVEPRWPVVWALGEPFYARVEGDALVVCVCDAATVEPDRATLDPAVVARLHERVAACLPDFAGLGLARAWCGLRTFAEDGDFVIGPDPALAHLVWVGGLGGHGITAASTVARLASDWIVEGGSRDPLAPHFAPGRAALGAG